MFTQEDRDQVLKHQDVFLKYSRHLQGRTGGDVQSLYRDLNKSTGSTAVSQALRGINAKLSDSIKRADRMGWTCNLDLEYLSRMWLTQRGECNATGVLMNFESGSTDVRNHLACSVDRLNSVQGYLKGNVRLLTHWANNAMNTWDDQLFEQMIARASQKIAERTGQ